MILTGRVFAEVGQALYGDDWESTVARKLERSRRTVIRWKTGEGRLPIGTRAKLMELIDEQDKLLQNWREKLGS